MKIAISMINLSQLLFGTINKAIKLDKQGCIYLFTIRTVVINKIQEQEHSSLMVTVVGLEFGIYKSPGFASA